MSDSVNQAAVTSTSIAVILDLVADSVGDRIAVGGREDGPSYAEMRGRARSGAADIARRRASSVLFIGEMSSVFPVALFAAAYAGVPFVPLNYRLGGDQLLGLLERHPGALVIADDLEGLWNLGGGISAVHSQSWYNETSLASEAHTGEEPMVASEAVIIYTSGTTSEPKGVVLRGDNLVGYVFDTVEFLGSPEPACALVCVPPYHIAAVANLLTNVFAGRRVLMLPAFSGPVWLDAVRAEGVTSAMVVPTMLARIINCESAEFVPTLRHVSYGGAPMPSSVISKAMTLWPEVDFVNAYGLTETSSTISLLGPEDHRAAMTSQDPVVRSRIGSVGLPLPNVRIEIRDHAGRLLSPGERGRIHVAGPQVSGEYRGAGKAVDERGFFDTRDEGFLDRDGYLYVAGRADDTIIRGGENIAPAEIEEVLLLHNAVSDAVVVGLPDEEWGQRLAAAVVAEDGFADADALRDFVMARLRSSKTPDRFEFWDELPRTETGKLLRKVVIARIAADASA